MSAPLKARLIGALASLSPKIICPSCLLSFKPYGNVSLENFSDLQIVQCPGCGKKLDANQILPPGQTLLPEPSQQPSESKITSEVYNGELVYFIPKSGKSGGLLFFAILWNAISWTIFVTFLSSLFKGQPNPSFALFIVALFPLTGLILLYISLRQKYATHLLGIGPENLRLQRNLFGKKKTYTLSKANIREVERTVFYSQNYRPVHGIQIGQGRRAIKFGSALSEPEKAWLCGEIRRRLGIAKN